MKTTEFLNTDFDDLYIVKFKHIPDNRGLFIKPYISEDFSEYFGEIAEIYFSFSTHKTFRGLHFQKRSSAQKKFIIPLSGNIIHAAVDLRKDKKSYKKAFIKEFHSREPYGVLVPEGFANGFYANSDCCIMNMSNAKYSPEMEGGISYLSVPKLCNLDVDFISKKDELLSDIDEY